MEEFRKCVDIRNKGARVIISCKLGLWEVDATDYSLAIIEAMHYFLQYKSDGEYDSILKIEG